MKMDAEYLLPDEVVCLELADAPAQRNSQEMSGASGLPTEH